MNSGLRGALPAPKLPIALIFRNLNASVLALRFQVRTLLHLLDSLDLIVDFGRNLNKLNPFDDASEDDTAGPTL